MPVTGNFYSELKAFSQFSGICNLENYTQLPDDWLVIITDIKDSTQAIQQGKYRAVNAVGVASIIAILNAVKPLSIPFVFGGDGASLCVPQSCITQVKKIFRDFFILQGKFLKHSLSYIEIFKRSRN